MSQDPPLRRPKAILEAQPAIEGAGVHLKRAFGDRQVPRLDPFLLLDDFHSDNPADYVAGFPWHPHRGMETVSYIVDGRVEHGDTLGNRGVIGPGDVQWMTAGSGIIHQEMPKGRDGRMQGLQLWVNLPRQDKMMDPRYQEIRGAVVPTASLGKGVSARVVAGDVGGVKGPVRDLKVDPQFLDVRVEPGAEFRIAGDPKHTMFAYTLEGRGVFDPETGDEVDGEHLVLYGPGREVRVGARTRPTRFLLISGRPLGEPVAWWGPMVMNTRGEIEEAIAEFQAGTFVKKRGSVSAGAA